MLKSITRWLYIPIMLGAPLFAADSPSAPSDADRLAAEVSKRKYFQAMASMQQAQSQVTTFQEQARSAAQDFNTKLSALKDKCASKEINDDTLVCAPEKPKPAPEPVPAGAKK